MLNPPGEGFPCLSPSTSAVISRVAPLTVAPWTLSDTRGRFAREQLDPIARTIDPADVMKEVRRNAKNFADRLERQGLMPFGRKIVTPDPDTFIEIRGRGKYPEFLTKYTAEELSKEGWQLMQIEGLDAIAALTPEMDLVNVANASGLRDIAEELVVEDIKRGAKTLDCFEGYLSNQYYPKFGFVKTGQKAKFDPAYAHPKWDYEKGEPLI